MNIFGKDGFGKQGFFATVLASLFQAESSVAHPAGVRETYIIMYSIRLVFFYIDKTDVWFFFTSGRGDQFFAPVETGTLTAGEDNRGKGYLFTAFAKRRSQTQGTLRGEFDISDGYRHSDTNAVVEDSQALRSEKKVPGLGKDWLSEKEESGEKEER